MSVPRPRPPHNPEGSRATWLAEMHAAEHVGVSPRTLRRWVADGKIRAYRAPGGRLRFRLDELDASMAPVPNGAAR
jgi:excisionase family DNA binding protein